MKRVLSLTLVALLLLSCFSFGMAEEKKHTLAISVPLTGNLMQYGVSYRNGVQLAVEDFNAAGGIDGQDVKLAIYDDKGDQKEAINVANIIIENEDVFAVIGSYGSSLSMAAGPVYQDAQLPMISPNTSHPDYQTLGDMMIPMSCKSQVIFGEVGRRLIDQFPGGKLAFIYQNTDVGITTIEAVEETFTAAGGSICASETFVPGQTKDYTPLLSSIKKTEPDILFVVAEYSDGASIVLQSKQLGMDNVQLVGVGNVFKQEFVDLTGAKADGMLLMGIARIYTEQVMAQSDYGEYTEDVVARYNEKYGDTGVMFDNFAGIAYDSAMAAMNAAKNVDTSDPLAMVAEIKKLDIPQCAGKAYFNEKDELTREVFTFTVENGQFVMK